jgi:hypothetical protein
VVVHCKENRILDFRPPPSISLSPWSRSLCAGRGSLLYALAAANALLVFLDFAIRHGGATLPLRLMFAFGCAVLPVLVALILARLFTKPDLQISTEGVTSSFQVNLEIFWSLSLMIAALVELSPIHQA